MNNSHASPSDKKVWKYRAQRSDTPLSSAKIDEQIMALQHERIDLQLNEEMIYFVQSQKWV